MHIYIGNLSRAITDAQLQECFEAYGTVTKVNIAKDRRNQVSKGFGNVEMESDEEGQAAIDGLKGQLLDGKIMDVVESGPPPGKKKKGSFKGGGKKRRRF